MQVLEIDRVMLATPDAREAIDRYESLLDVSFTDVVLSETETADGVNRNDVAYAEPGFEVIEPADEENGVAHFLEEHGPGLFGLVFRVADVGAAKAELAEQGVEPIAEETPDGVPEVHYHPADFGGVYTLLTAYPHPGFERAEH